MDKPTKRLIREQTLALSWHSGYTTTAQLDKYIGNSTHKLLCVYTHIIREHGTQGGRLFMDLLRAHRKIMD